MGAPDAIRRHAEWHRNSVIDDFVVVVVVVIGGRQGVVFAENAE